jgi:hypothetical protein
LSERSPKGRDQERREDAESKLRMIQIIGMVLTGRNRRAWRLRRGVQIVAAFGLAALGCKHEEPPPPAPPGPTKPAPAPPPAAAPAVPDAPPADARAALAWIDALRERDPGAVLEKSLIPFDFRDAGPRNTKCPTRAAITHALASSVAKCLAKDMNFHADLSATPEPRVVAVDAGALPPWAQGWAKTIRPGLRALSTFVHGETEARELVLLVGDDGVHGLWQNVISEPK